MRDDWTAAPPGNAHLELHRVSTQLRISKLNQKRTIKLTYFNA